MIEHQTLFKISVKVGYFYLIKNSKIYIFSFAINLFPK